MKNRPKTENTESWVSLTEYARLTGRSVGTIGVLVKQPGFPYESGGGQGNTARIHFTHAFKWEIARAKKTASPNETGRLRREQADKLALENAVRRGQLCEQSDVRSVVIGAVHAFRNERNGIASRLANELAGLTPAEIRVRILDELRRVDEQFSQRVGPFTQDNDAMEGRIQ